MKRMLKWLAGLVGIVLLAIACLFTFAWFKTEHDLARTYVVADPPLVMAMDDASRARGAHLFTVQGCNECHGEGGVGHELFDGGPVARMVAPNITPTKLRGRYDADGIAAAIRHGVKPDGTPLRFMPVGDFNELSDADTAALVGHVQALAPSDNDPGQLEIRPLGRVLAALGKFNLTPAAKLDHTPRARIAPPQGPTAAYGEYLAHGCTGCHGADFAGGHVPGTPPELADAANLTPHVDGLAKWSQADFERAFRHGVRPDGRKLDEFMPWKVFANLSDDDVAAIYAFLRTVPAKSSAGK